MEKIQITYAHPNSAGRLQHNLGIDAYRIVLLKGARGKLLVDCEYYPLNPFTIAFVYPGQQFELPPQKPAEAWVISFEESFFYINTEHKELLFRSPFFGYVLSSPLFRINAKQYEMFASITSQMLHEQKLHAERSDQVMLSFLNIFLLYIKRMSWGKNTKVHHNDYTTLQIVSRFKHLIRTHCHQQHSVKWYADQLQQTSNYLNLMVKKVTGGTAGDLIADQLTMEAKRLLMHTKLSPKEVAFTLGFYDHSYFSKFFKKQTGYNPLEWFNRNK